MAALIFAVAAIFMYHHVSPSVQPGPYQRALTVTPAEFQMQLAWLRDHGCATRTLSDLVRDVRSGSSGCEVALTFDDGYDDAATHALPLLARASATGTFFITTGFVGSSGHVSARQVRELAAGGMEIGAHTVSHLDLTQLPPAQARTEIDRSKAALERWLGSSITSFAYPAGRTNTMVESYLKGAGFRAAVTTLPGIVTSRALADPFALPRYRIMRGEGIALFSRVLAPAEGSSPSAPNRRALEHIARARIEGNDQSRAERVAVALLEGAFPEQILKVRVLKAGPAEVAGIMLLGLKFHGPVSTSRFASDVNAMIDRTFAAAPSLSEVDVWAVVPIKVSAGVVVSGDLAAATSRTVFSIAATRDAWAAPRGRQAAVRETFWDETWQTTFLTQ